MLLLVNSSLWQLGGCLILVAGAHYAFGHWVIDLGSIYTQLKQLVALPTLTDGASTWPGEDDDEYTFRQPDIAESKTNPTVHSTPSAECLNPVAHEMNSPGELIFA